MRNGFAGGVDVHFCRRTDVWIDGRNCRMDWLEDLALRLVRLIPMKMELQNQFRPNGTKRK